MCDWKAKYKMTIVGEDKTQGGHNVSQRQCFVWELAETGFCRVSHGKETAIYVNNVKGFSRRRAPPSFEVLKVVHVTTRYYTLLREEEEEEGEQQEEAAEMGRSSARPPDVHRRVVADVAHGKVAPRRRRRGRRRRGSDADFWRRVC